MQSVAMNFYKLANSYTGIEHIFCLVVHFESAVNQKNFLISFGQLQLLSSLQSPHCTGCIWLHAVPFSMLCQSLPGIHGMSPLEHHQCQELDMVEEDHLARLLMSYVAKQLKEIIFELKPKSLEIYLHCAWHATYTCNMYSLCERKAIRRSIQTSLLN